MAAQVQPFFDPGTHTFSYVVHDPGTRQAAIIDPVLDFEPIAARTGLGSAQALVDHANRHGLQVQWILETHAHADHLTAAQWLKTQYPQAQLAIGQGIRAVQAHFAPLFGQGDSHVADGSQFDHLFADNEVFGVGELAVRVIAVPGHTSDSNAYLIGDALFTGDSLFMPDAGTARCDFPGGDAATLYRSIQRLYELPEATRVFICHDYGPGGRPVACESTIGEQRRDNVHVGDGTSESGFVALRTARDATLTLPTLIIPSLEVNLRGGALPEPEHNGTRYLRIPLDSF